MRSRSLEYLVTLDSLPILNADGDGDCRLVDGPEGYGKIRLTGREADTWEELMTPSGYLCRYRQKVYEKSKSKGFYLIASITRFFQKIYGDLCPAVQVRMMLETT